MTKTLFRSGLWILLLLTASVGLQAQAEEKTTAEPASAQEYSKRGHDFIEKGEFEKAIADFDKAIELDPKNAGAYINRGFSYSQLRQFDKALADYTQAIALDPKNADIYQSRGIVYFRLEQLDDAVRDYEQAQEIDPQDKAISSGLEFMRRSKSIKADPKVVANYVARGRAALELEFFDGALADFDKAIYLEPQNAQHFNDRGLAHAATGKNEQALTDYERALALDPGLAAAYSNRIAVYEKQLGEKSSALVIADATQLLRLNDKDVVTRSRRAQAYRRQKNYDAAIADLTRVLEDAPQFEEARAQRGLVYFEKGDYDRARSDIEAVKNEQLVDMQYRIILDASKEIGQNPSDPSPYLKRADLFILFFYDYRKAFADVQTALRLDPKNARAYALRARIYSDDLSPLQDADKAVADLNQGLRFDKNNATLYNKRANALLLRGEYDRAFADYLAATNLDPGYAGGSYHRGLHTADEEWKKAIAHYDAALQRNPKNAEAALKRAFYYGEFDEQPNQWDNVIAGYTRALQLNPKNARAFLLRGIARERRIAEESWQRHEEKRKDTAADMARAQQEKAGALADYNQAIRFDPNLAPAYFYRALAHEEAKEVDRAIADYSQFIRLRPAYAAHAYYQRAELYHQKQDWAKSIADIDAFFRLDRPITMEHRMYTAQQARRMRGHAHMMTNQWDKAITDYTEMGNGPSGMDITAYYVGNVHFRKGDYEQAVAHYARAISSSKNSPYVPALEGRAQAYRKLGKTELAEADEKQVAALKAGTK